uniref:Uncharacterized protein n=1 Tax=Equus asinus TaxID=9793 RepID=A0A9L0JZR6_EQUAS
AEQGGVYGVANTTSCTWINTPGKVEIHLLKITHQAIWLKKVTLSYDPAIPLLGIYPDNLKSTIQSKICTPMFIAALFTIAKTWKPSKCPSTDDWIKKMWYIYTMEDYSAIKKTKSSHLQQHGWT